MTWSKISDPIKLDIDWEFTEPALGTFFRFKHENAPVNAIYEIAQVELNSDDSYTLFDSQVLTLERGFVDVIKLVNPGIFNQRRLAIRRIPARPTFEQEIRRLLLPGYLQSTDIPPAAPARNRWQVQIEASDYIEATATVDLSSIQTKLDEISAKIDSLQSGSGGTPTVTGKSLTYESDGDTNGVFYWLGTNYGKQSWVNPYSAGFINITLSSKLNGFGFVDGNPAGLCDRTSNSVHTADEIGASVAVDLKVNQL